jgi:hypothetical protein
LVYIDYEEKYSPVTKFTSIEIIIMSIVVALDLELYQLDVKTFLKRKRKNGA